jgi:putative endonuclease
MGHYVYILHSASIDKYYVGYSTSPENRLGFHNSFLNSIWTSRGQPWEMKKTIVFDSSQAALRCERFIKKQKSRKFIEGIIRDGWRFPSI